MLCSRIVIVFLVLLLVSPSYAKTSSKPTKKPITKVSTVTVNQTKIPTSTTQNISVTQNSIQAVLSTSNPVVKPKLKIPISIIIIGSLDSGSVYATASGYKSDKYSVPISFTIGVEYDLGKFEKIEYGVGIRYLLSREVPDFKTKFSMIPVYGFGRMDIGNNILITGHFGYEIPKMETTVTGKWTGDFCYGIGIGYMFNQNVKVVGEYSINNAKYILDDFTMLWNYNIMSLAIRYEM